MFATLGVSGELVRMDDMPEPQPVLFLRLLDAAFLALAP
jgi:hypothetical protein